MNYGAEPADQVVRYTLEGTEFALKISGTAAKNFAVFALAVLRDQKKTHGKTKLVRLLREGKRSFSSCKRCLTTLRFFSKVFRKESSECAVNRSSRVEVCRRTIESTVSAV